MTQFILGIVGWVAKLLIFSWMTWFLTNHFSFNINNASFTFIFLFKDALIVVSLISLLTLLIKATWEE